MQHPDYWDSCLGSLGGKSQVRVVYRGVVAHALLADILQEYDALFLPTKTENFGHAIAEALAAGIPVLVSDQTPWRTLRARGAGWDLPLNRQDLFLNALRELVDLDEAAWGDWSESALHLAAHTAASTRADHDHRALFEAAIGGR